MKPRISSVIFIFLVVMFLFSAYSGQQTQPTLEIANTIMPSGTNTAQPTNTLQPTQIATATAITNPCARNPVLPELLANWPEIKNNKLVAFNTEGKGGRDWGLDYADIYTVQLDGSNLEKITDYPANSRMARWSPDGKKILFNLEKNQACANGNCEVELFIMNPDGTGARKLTKESKEHPFWSPDNPGRSPDGKEIAYVKEFPAPNVTPQSGGDILHYSDVYVVDANGSNVRNLTTNLQPGYIYGAENWSPDSKQLAIIRNIEYVYESQTQHGYIASEIYRVSSDGSTTQKLAGPLEVGKISPADWSPNGEKLAFLTPKGIAIINADGSGLSEYATKNSLGSRNIYWLDDNNLVFTDGIGDFYTIKSDFSKSKKLQLETELEKFIYLFQLLKAHEFEYSWNLSGNLSPDGKWIAYFEPSSDSENSCSQIRIVDTETYKSYFVMDYKDTGKLTINGNVPIHPGAFGNDLLWSPDSRQLVFTQSVNYGVILHIFHGLFSVNIDGTGLRLIAEDAWHPQIQP